MNKLQPAELRQHRRFVFTVRRAFTLIELLVVVAIIALLLAILMPSLQEARRQAKVVACGAHLHTIGQALVYYLQANQDYLPYSGGGGFENLHKYIQKVTLSSKTVVFSPAGDTPVVDVPWYLCPGDEVPHTTSEVEHTMPDGTTMKVQYLLGYGMNNSLSFKIRPDNEEGLTPTTRKMAEVKRPGNIVSYCGAGDDGLNGAQRWVLNESTISAYNQSEFEVHHKTGNNFLYCDGHVTYHKVLLKSPPQYGLPPFPWAWIPNYKQGGPYDDFERNPPISRIEY